MKLKVYEYQKCGTCRKAIQYLDSHKIEYEKIPIRETPPSVAELKKMLFFQKDIKKLLNTSGIDYRELKIKDKLPNMSESEILEMLSKNGNLIKRPFVLSKDFGLVGFKEEEWEKNLV
jgi:arsenate reductase